jgi:transcriptional regulator with XRE-family HTH domain
MDFIDVQAAVDDACVAALSVPRSWARASPNQQLRALRLARHISQRQLADESGLHQSLVSRLERGGDVRWTTWSRLFAALGYDVVMAPLCNSEEAEDLLREEAQRRKERIRAGLRIRW